MRSSAPALLPIFRSRLQADILAELSSLYSAVYSGDRLKNWPTIFVLASILLAVWEEMQLDSDPLDAAIDDHLYFSKEASSGGRSFAGGGCGCN